MGFLLGHCACVFVCLLTPESGGVLKKVAVCTLIKCPAALTLSKQKHLVILHYNGLISFFLQPER